MLHLITATEAVIAGEVVMAELADFAARYLPRVEDDDPFRPSLVILASVLQPERRERQALRAGR